MATNFQFGIALRTQYPMDADVSDKFADLMELVRLADALGPTHPQVAPIPLSPRIYR